MYIVKVLKRRDAASVMLAILLAMIASYPIQTITSQWATQVVKSDTAMYGYSPSWEDAYLMPLLTFVLSVFLVEVGLRAVIWTRGKLVRRTK